MSQALVKFLNDYLQGKALSEFDAGFDQLNSKVKQLGKGGEITFTLKVSPARKGSSVEMVCISHDIKVKLPRESKPEDLFFINDGGQLQRNHPNQQSFDLRDVKAAQPTEFKEVTRNVGF